MMDAIVAYVGRRTTGAGWVEPELEPEGKDTLDDLLRKFYGDRVLVTVQRLEEQN